MKKSDPSAHPYLRLVYSRPEPDLALATTIIQAVPACPQSHWPPMSAGSTTVTEFLEELRRFVEKETAAER